MESARNTLTAALRAWQDGGHRQGIVSVHYLKLMAAGLEILHDTGSQAFRPRIISSWYLVGAPHFGKLPYVGGSFSNASSGGQLPRMTPGPKPIAATESPAVRSHGHVEEQQMKNPSVTPHGSMYAGMATGKARIFRARKSFKNYILRRSG